MFDLSVVIPVHNSAQFLESRIRALSDYLQSSGITYEIIAVDDGSRDSSPEILSKLQLSNLRIILNKQNKGKFGAIAEGMAEARGNCCLFTDADIPYELSAIPYMLKLINERQFHLVIGDRTLPGSHYRSDLTVLRKVMTVGFTFFVRVFVTGGLFDTQCGIKAFRRDVAKSIFPLLQETGFAGDVELLYIALKNNLEIKRIPARLQFQGNSTVRPARDAIRMLQTVVRIRGRFKSGMYHSPALEEIGRQDYWT
ncbi:MAG: glycosyltransferase [Planctomycetota bacterium]